MKRKYTACSVGVLADAAVYLSGITFGEYYLEPPAFKKFWESGVLPFKQIFASDAEYIKLPGLSCPPVSYAHIAALGGRLNYPEDSEPNVVRMFDNLDEGISWLSRDHDFADNDLFRRYISYTEALNAYFPGKNIKIGGLGFEGPVTTAVLLRGQDFFVDIYERPEQAETFLRLATDSAVSYSRFLKKITGAPELPDAPAGLADDFAALLSPEMFYAFAIPCWNRYYAGMTKTGARSLHCEGFVREHLKYLSYANISFFDPTVSQKLSCRMLSESLDIPFSWTLPSFELAAFDSSAISDWMENTLAYAPECVLTELDRNLMRTDGIEKIRAFISTYRSNTAENAPVK